MFFQVFDMTYYVQFSLGVKLTLWVGLFVGEVEII